MVPEKAIPLEFKLDEFHAISWTKGCYPGQELTARTKHLGVVRKSIYPAILKGGLADFGSKIMLEDQDVGTILSSINGRALCQIRLEAMEKSQSQNISLTYEGGYLTFHQST